MPEPSHRIADPAPRSAESRTFEDGDPRPLTAFERKAWSTFTAAERARLLDMPEAEREPLLAERVQALATAIADQLGVPVEGAGPSGTGDPALLARALSAEPAAPSSTAPHREPPAASEAPRESGRGRRGGA